MKNNYIFIIITVIATIFIGNMLYSQATKKEDDPTTENSALYQAPDTQYIQTEREKESSSSVLSATQSVRKNENNKNSDDDNHKTSQELMNELNKQAIVENVEIQKGLSNSLNTIVEEDNSLSAYSYGSGGDQSLSFFDRLFGRGSKTNVNSTDRDLLARIIQAEAESEPYSGKVAVGAVVLNRTKSGKFPRTVKEVIYAKGQFEPISNGRFDRINVDKEAYKAADEAIGGSDPTGGALYFYAPTMTAQRWHETLTFTVEIGGHKFFK